MRTSRRSRRAPRASAPDPVHDALTELSAYVLALDIECHRLDAHVSEFGQAAAPHPEREALLRERDEITEELAAMRAVISALRKQLTLRAAT